MSANDDDIRALSRKQLEHLYDAVREENQGMREERDVLDRRCARLHDEVRRLTAEVHEHKLSSIKLRSELAAADARLKYYRQQLAKFVNLRDLDAIEERYRV